jgi:hypothetical protein
MRHELERDFEAVIDRHGESALVGVERRVQESG